MKRSLLRIVLFCSLLFVKVSCSRSELNEANYYKYLNDPENGLIQVKEANGFRLEMKYLPPDLQAFNELSRGNEEIDHKRFDSVIKQYENGFTFLLSISDPEINPGEDIVQYGIFNEQEFKRRFNELHFNIDSHIWISDDSAKVPPALSMLESTFELSGPKTFYLVFEKSEIKTKRIDVVFKDAFFDTGINHFIFKTEDINNLPKISF
jgi:hypothetical protein